MTMPFAMTDIDMMTSEERGYRPIPTKWIYDPRTQMSNIISMGGTLVLSSVQEQDSDTESDSED